MDQPKARQQTSEAIYKKYPRLYEHCPISVGDGWLPIIEEVSEKLEALFQAMPPEQQAKAIKEGGCKPCQIKEKFGDLCYYMDGGTPEMLTAVHEAEELARKICEDCGKRGRKWAPGYWVKTLCDRCIKQSVEGKIERVVIRDLLFLIDVLVPHVPPQDWAIVLTKVEPRTRSSLVSAVKQKILDKQGKNETNAQA